MQQMISRKNRKDIVCQHKNITDIQIGCKYPDDLSDKTKAVINKHYVNIHFLSGETIEGTYEQTIGHWLVSYQCPCRKKIYVFDSLKTDEHRIKIEEQMSLYYETNAYSIEYYSSNITQQGMF